MSDTQQRTDDLVQSPEGGGWRNLYFTTGGRTYWSANLHETDTACRIASAWFFGEWPAYIAEGGSELVETWSGDLVLFEAFLFAVPMPWQP